MVSPPRAGEGAYRAVGGVGTVQTGKGMSTAIGAENGFGPIYKKPQIHNVVLPKESTVGCFLKAAQRPRDPGV